MFAAVRMYSMTDFNGVMTDKPTNKHVVKALETVYTKMYYTVQSETNLKE